MIGGGILGLAVARELLARHPDSDLCLLEREDRLAAHQTSHSSGVVHAGIYYEPGSLKARLCVEGARLLYAYCEERGIEARKSGKLIVAAGDSELPRLDELERRGRENQVPGLRRIDADGISEIEPHARGVAALHSPETGVVDFGQVAASYAADVKAGGGIVATGCGVQRLVPGGRSIRVEHERGSTEAGFVITCAGAWSDRLAVAAGAPAEPRIVPFRGGYLRLRPERRGLVRSMIYPVPDPDLPFLGGHLTRTIDGEVLLGPSALMVGSRDAYRISRLRGPRPRFEPLLARHLAACGSILENGADGDPPRRQQARLRLGPAPLRPGAQRRRRAARPIRDPRPGARPRRQAGRRLRRAPDRARAAHPQRPLPRRDVIPGTCQADRRREPSCR